MDSNKKELSSNVQFEIIKKMNVKALLIYSILIVIGVLCLVAYSTQENKTTNMSMFYMSIGAIFIATGLILMLAKNRHDVYAPTGSPVKKFAHFFHREDMEKLINLLNNKTFPNASPITFSPNASMRMNIIHSADKKIASVQLFEYIPHSYEPASKLFYYTDSEASDFLNYIKDCKS